jgi:hypothetical protein
VISTSAEFQALIGTQTALREMYGKVVFKQVDVTAKSDATATASSTNSASSPSYTINGTEEAIKNYATFEDDRWILDGTFALAPDIEPFVDIEYLNDYLSDASTRLVTPNLKYYDTFLSDHTSVGITIIFDVGNNEWAEEFDIIYYDSGLSIIDTVVIIGNTDAYFVDETDIINYRKIEIVVKKWSKGNRFARINEVYFGIIYIFSKENGLLMKFKNEEFVDLISETIKANNLDFSIDNTDQKYNILNPAGGYQYLQTLQELESYIGIKLADNTIEYVKMGLFFLNTWETTKDELEAKFIGVGKLELMHQRKFYKGLKQSTTMYAEAIRVIEDYGYISTDYNIDVALQSITLDSFLPILSYKECLQAVSIASQSVLYEDRDGVINIKQLTRVSTGYTIKKENMYIDVPKIELGALLKQVDVNVFTITEALALSDIAISTKNISGTKDILIIYDNPASTVSAVISSGTINTSTFYTNACFLNVTATGATTITVSGKVLTLTADIETTSTTNTDGEIRNINVSLITDDDVANDVGAWIKTELELRNIFDPYWRHDPSVEIGDLLDIENQFVTQTDVVVRHNKFIYDGGLEGTTDVKG